MSGRHQNKRRWSKACMHLMTGVHAGDYIIGSLSTFTHDVAVATAHLEVILAKSPKQAVTTALRDLTWRCGRLLACAVSC